MLLHKDYATQRTSRSSSGLGTVVIIVVVAAAALSALTSAQLLAYVSSFNEQMSEQPSKAAGLWLVYLYERTSYVRTLTVLGKKDPNHE